MRALLAGLPILTVLGLMVGLRWTAARAGSVGVAVTGGLAVAVFGLGTTELADLGVPGAIGGPLLEALFTAATILWIILPALAIHHMNLRSGGTEVLRVALGGLTGDLRVTALLIAWFFALFMEGAAGFGASVALAAPFLVGAGFRKVEAVTAALIGHAVGVSFGAVGTPILPQVAATGLTGLELSRATGLYHGLLGWMPLLAMMLLVSRMPAEGDAATGERRPVWGLTALAGMLFLGPYVALSTFVGPELPTLGGALFGGLAFVGALLRQRRRAGVPTPALISVGEPGRSDAAPLEVTGTALLRAASPYLVLVAAVLLTRLVPPLQAALRSVELSWDVAGTFSGSVQPLYHPGTMLAIGFLAGALVQHVRWSDVRSVLSYTLGRLGGVTVALLAMLGLSRLMVHAGMTGALAEGAVAAAGGAWPVLAPLVGVLGTFVTGSATASNILFTDVQVSAAEGLSLPVAPMAAAQGFGAAVGNVVCPHNVVAASATVALEGREGEVLRRTLGVALTYALLGGALALALVS
jgi:lactate permease